MGASMFLPLIASAQSLAAQCLGQAGRGDSLESVVCTIYRLIRIVIPVLILGAVAYFIWGIVKFISSDGEEKEAGRGMMINGIVAFAVILGLWGLVYILLNTFGVRTGGVNEGTFPTF